MLMLTALIYIFIMGGVIGYLFGVWDRKLLREYEQQEHWVHPHRTVPPKHKPPVQSTKPRLVLYDQDATGPNPPREYPAS